MTVHVRFRFNKLTGEVEEFLVDDQDQTLPESEHDRVALAVARVLAAHPQLREVPPGQIPAPVVPDESVETATPGDTTLNEPQGSSR